MFILTSLANDYPPSNIDARFEAHHYLMFPSRSIHTDGIRAGVMVSSN
jgi:hypothetical protein